jgi:hypothetical protein
MPWVETAETTQYEAKPGQDLITKQLENLDSNVSPPQWPPKAFNKEFTISDGKATARHSVYQGNNADQYIIRGSMSQEPIATHPMFHKGDSKIEAEEWKKYRKWQADPDSTTWRPDGGDASANFKKFFAFIERGTEYFLNGTCEIQITEMVTGTPSIRALGRIDSPPRAPALPNGRTWLIVGVDAEKIGDEWRQTTTYRASMDFGWDEQLYKR